MLNAMLCTILFHSVCLFTFGKILSEQLFQMGKGWTPQTGISSAN